MGMAWREEYNKLDALTSLWGDPKASTTVLHLSATPTLEPCDVTGYKFVYRIEDGKMFIPLGHMDKHKNIHVTGEVRYTIIVERLR